MILLKRLSKTEVKYGILTTRKGTFRDMLPSFGEEIVFIDADGGKHNLFMHKTASGRIDGLTRVYRDYDIVSGDFVGIDKDDKGNFVISFWILNRKKKLTK